MNAFDRLRSKALMLLATGVLLAGCTGPQQTAATPAPTGITANNGGGVRSLNNQPDITVTTVVRP